MQSSQILEKYLRFFKAKNHQEIPNLSLVPENDPSLLFVNSGMFPLVPYLSGEPHPLGKRLTNVQRSMRFEDLEEVGDNRHTTAFHMLGNWSLGDYFKKEQLVWIYAFFIEELQIDPKRLFASVFSGDEKITKDTESIAIIKQVFQKYGISAKENERIFAYGKKDNWWQRGEAIGELGGPDSEIFYYLGNDSGVGKNPAQNQSEFIEIGNSVFMQYKRTQAGWSELPQKNVDFGGGLERIAMVTQKTQDIFTTDNFMPIISQLEQLSGQHYGQNPQTTRAMRILADHLRAATLLAMDGVIPSNKDQGYALRRILRRLIRFGQKQLGLKEISHNLFDSVIEAIGWLYPQLEQNKSQISTLFSEEESRFSKTLNRGQKQAQIALCKLNSNPQPSQIAKLAFDLYQSSGYPPELFAEDLSEQGIKISLTKFNQAYQQYLNQHQALSRQGATAKFKGGLADHSEIVVKYHTATHLLHQALRQILKKSIEQQGSNITHERLRFDFSYPQPLSEAQISQTEQLIASKIKQQLPVNFITMPKAQAIKSGALHSAKNQYPDQVKVYFIGSSLKQAFSKEFCGGPHVQNLKELKPLKIYKQESISKGVRRVYARFV